MTVNVKFLFRYFVANIRQCEDVRTIYALYEHACRMLLHHQIDCDETVTSELLALQLQAEFGNFTS